MNTWGKDLYEHLDWVYQRAARYCVLFASEAYANKVWTTHERQSAQARALASTEEYVLPVRFDDTDIPGIRPTIKYVDARTQPPGKLAKMIAQKVGPKKRENYLPPTPDRLFAALDVESPEEEGAVIAVAESFMKTLIRMSIEERQLIAHLFAEGCPSEIPENIHVSLDVVRRDLGIEPDRLIERLQRMASIGIVQEVRPNPDHDGDEVVVVRWFDLMNHSGEFIKKFSDERSTEVAVRMLITGKGGHYCPGCDAQRIDKLDFSLLSSSMVKA